MTSKPKPPRTDRELRREAEEFLIARGWWRVGRDRWRHERVSCPWPFYDAERLERESKVPLSKRVEPFKGKGA